MAKQIKFPKVKCKPKAPRGGTGERRAKDVVCLPTNGLSNPFKEEVVCHTTTLVSTKPEPPPTEAREEGATERVLVSNMNKHACIDCKFYKNAFRDHMYGGTYSPDIHYCFHSSNRVIEFNQIYGEQIVYREGAESKNWEGRCVDFQPKRFNIRKLIKFFKGK